MEEDWLIDWLTPWMDKWLIDELTESASDPFFMEQINTRGGAGGGVIGSQMDQKKSKQIILV